MDDKMRADLLRIAIGNAPTLAPPSGIVPSRQPVEQPAAPPRPLSGVSVRTEKDFLWDVELLAQQILRSCNEGGLASWCMIQLFPLLQPFHWDAYAKLAGIDSPSRPLIAASIARFRQLIQYPAEGT